MILRFPQRRRSSQTLRIVLEREMNNRNDQMTHSERIEHMQKSGPCFRVAVKNVLAEFVR